MPGVIFDFCQFDRLLKMYGTVFVCRATAQVRFAAAIFNAEFGLVRQVHRE
jgi:hypothetical protein